MATLESGFESDLREAVLDQVEADLVGERDNLAFDFVQRVHDNLREYGRRHDYDVEPIIDSLGQPAVSRGPRAVMVRLEWTHEAAAFFELGTSDHPIQGDPVLSFVWDGEDAPAWVAEEFEREGEGYRVFLPEVEVSGLPESRAIRDALNAWERQLSR